MFTHHPPAAAGPASPSPIIPSSAPSPSSPTSLSSRLRTLSVLRSYTHRVTTPMSSNSIGNNNNNINNNINNINNNISNINNTITTTTTTTSSSSTNTNDQASPPSPTAPPHSRHIEPLSSSITRSASYHAALESPTASPGARGSTSCDDSIVPPAAHPSPCTTATTAGGSGSVTAGGTGRGARQLGPVAVVSTSIPSPSLESPSLSPSPSAPPITTTSSSSSSPLSEQQQQHNHHLHHLHLRHHHHHHNHPPPRIAAPQPPPDSGAHLMTRTAAALDPLISTPSTTSTIANANANTGPGASPPGMSTTQPPSAILPSIRFTTYIDPRSQRPSLTFQATTRILPTGSEIIRVGRYSERDGHGTPISTGSDRAPNASPVGFKSKVVSRRHCEFWFDNGKWYIKDVKSSSGTFLNHIRLSPPGTESRPYPVNDGDIVQLGIDFKGGEEMIFRCVKMRLELNRGWISKPTNFNLASHKRLRTLVGSGSGSSSQDCSICLNSIAPCQSLFVAPCSHTWHYKCIRSLLATPSYPYFQCPNCRASADLEAEVDDPDQDWENLNSDDAEAEEHDKDEPPAPLSLELHAHDPDNELLAPALDPVSPVSPVSPASPRPSPDPAHMPQDAHHHSPARSPGSPGLGSETPPPPDGATIGWTRSAPVPIYPHCSGGPEAAPSRRGKRTPSPSQNPALNGTEGPITPRNDAGPWVFDGSAGRRLLMGGAAPGPVTELSSASIDHAIDD